MTEMGWLIWQAEAQIQFALGLLFFLLLIILSISSAISASWWHLAILYS
uniref:Uncharacterized protein n=1 Tax=Setaria italica TaxID=4555 RepID=K3ZZ24_SETIT